MNTILIANRGEIALRIMRTARRLGFRCAAVYSDADAGAEHVRAADAACGIGAGPARDSYLNVPAILAAARKLGADAVHPGYGFLAENAEFAEAVRDAGLVWIGPSPAAMRAMGNKAAAKRLLAERDVPMLPGYQDSQQDAATLLREASRIGLPLMIKAAAGGGGRGMRLVREEQELAEALARARSESEQAFGSGELILERALIAPRHVEVQVFADSRGNVVHLGERDCSVQRRHQKLIEEAPSPAVDAALRARLGAAAVQAARACGYVGAGTIEFLLDADGGFWFMEMNTRLQVEHPVTEEITGLDLVEWQLRIAQGEALPLSQEDIDARLARGGHAIEVRLCAEDPAAAFLPQSGRVLSWMAAPDLRVEHALSDGAEVPPYYDSMLAKIVARGANRDEARRRLLRGLQTTRLLGIASNQDFLADCLAHPGFAAGEARTDFIDAHFPASARAAPAPSFDVQCAAAVVALARRLPAAPAYPDELAGWNSSGAFADSLDLEIDDTRCSVPVRANGPLAWIIGTEGQAVRVRIAERDAAWVRLEIDGGVQETVGLAASGDLVYWRYRNRNHTLRDLIREPAQTGASRQGGGLIRAPMSGKVTAVHVTAGASVKAGEAMLVLEAMKMEHTVTAPCAGVVEALHVHAGDQAGPGMVLAEIRPQA
ncbi:MAG TPA: biotin carboxylase N-terminal domain-containing protein [Noviherbaspirillum sp.]|nr:biotin carboxylase N-terminal domain-containing protein [Noviherbaspirillum sp.]